MSQSYIEVETRPFVYANSPQFIQALAPEEMFIQSNIEPDDDYFVQRMDHYHLGRQL